MQEQNIRNSEDAIVSGKHSRRMDAFGTMDSIRSVRAIQINVTRSFERYNTRTTDAIRTSERFWNALTWQNYLATRTEGVALGYDDGRLSGG